MDALSGNAPLTPSSLQPAQSQGTAAALSSDFETFLTMLTVQMQNQDPLNPVEASDFAVQLATFSSVEQQVQTNELLQNLTSNLAGNPLQEMGAWVGMEALVTGAGHFDGSPISLLYESPELATAVHLVVRDAEGNEVYKQELDREKTRVEWDGMGLDGTLQDHGLYRFSIEPSILGKAEPDPELPVRVYVPIDEIRMEGSDALVRLANGEEIPSSQVSGLRAPGGL